MSRIFHCKLTSAQTLALASLLIACLFNYPFLSAAYEAIAPQSVWDWFIFLSIPIVLTCLTIVFLSVTGALFFPRFVIALSILLSSLLLYGSMVYGVIYDGGMIQNLIETNSSEALSYLNVSFILFFFFLGLFPIVALFNQDLREAFTEQLKGLLKINLLALIAIAILFGLVYKDYAAVGRNHRNLTKYIIPYAFYDAGYKYVRDSYFYPPLPFRILDKHPTLQTGASAEPKTLVVVVGETARADRFSLNGYSRPTNPSLSTQDVVSFTHVSSCGTATAVSVPCMFSRLPRLQYDSRLANSQDNALDIIHRAGVDVTWIDNNSSCKGVCARIDTQEFKPDQPSPLCDGDYCFDEILLQKLREQLQNPGDKSRMVVLHMIGSHGPTYYRRYPDSFKKFLPDCPQSDIQNCTNEQLANTYDNTIAYTDYVLSNIVSLLSNTPNAAMLYISDHGESLGEKHLYLHGFPYSIAPEEQTHVPMVYWDSNFHDPRYRTCTQQQAESQLSQDNVFDTLLGLAGVNSIVYNPDLDIFDTCRNNKSV